MTDPTSADAKVLHQGADLSAAKAAIILIHGRGATADGIIRLAGTLDPEGTLPIAWLAPQAQGNTWYPLPFMEPIDRNEPERTHALEVIDQLIADVIDRGIPSERIGLVGFSQGACLSLEHAAVGSNLPAFVGALSGGVMGPDADSRVIDRSRAGLRVFIGCGDRDGHIPIERAATSAKLFEDAGATVDFRRYTGMDHTINDDEIGALRTLVAELGEGQG